MSLVFAVEKFTDWQEEARPMFDAHYLEIASFQDACQLDPDYSLAARLDSEGRLVAMTARSSEGALAGYALFVLSQMAHYKSVTMAECDLFYLSPEYRRGMAGYRFLSFTKSALAGLSIQRIRYRCKIAHDWSPILSRLGCIETERVFEVMA